MLIRFRVQNFRSLRDSQEFSMAATSLKDLPDSTVAAEGLSHGLLRAAAIYGANASGKTNVLKALFFACRAVLDSHASWKPETPVPYDPFLLEKATSTAASSFEIDLLLNGTRYQYSFAICREGIVREELLAFPRGRRQRWFSRKAGSTMRFSKNLQGENRAIESLMRKNSLFLSAAAQNGHRMLTPVFRWFVEGVSFVMHDRRDEALHTARVCKARREREAVWKLLSGADLGLAGLGVEDLAPDKQVRQVLNVLQDAFPGMVRDEVGAKRPVLRLRHKGKDGRAVDFPLSKESDGTLAYIGILGSVVSALRDGDTICIDELDASLHPLLSSEIVRLFNDPRRNPKAAQLVFTTHDTNLLDPSLLRRDQIWFTEKDRWGATHLYPLTDFKPRKYENVKHGYIQGRYGAIPFIGPMTSS